MTIERERREPGIVVVSINRPERRNALTRAMFEDLAALWPELASDAAVRTVILTGGGAAFCSGADLGESLDQAGDIDDLVDRALLKTRFFSKPIVAAIRGPCVAGGLELALAADVRIAADDASLGLPEVRWGMMPSGGGAMKLIDQVGTARAMDLLLSGELVTGAEAAHVGLVTQACADAEVMARALAKARAIAANSPVAVRAAKAAASAERIRRYKRLEAGERALVTEVRASGHPTEGRAAFTEKRRPTWPTA